MNIIGRIILLLSLLAGILSCIIGIYFSIISILSFSSGEGGGGTGWGMIAAIPSLTFLIAGIVIVIVCVKIDQKNKKIQMPPK